MLDVHLRRGEYEPINYEIKNHYLKLNKIIQDDAFRSDNFYYNKYINYLYILNFIFFLINYII